MADKQSLAPVGPGRPNMMKTRLASEWINEARYQPNPNALWGKLWNEGEIACLFADSNLGKSILGLQMAAEISVRHSVIYFDFEMSAKQFQLRYTDPATGRTHPFNPTMMRCEIDPSLYQGDDFEDAVLYDIERTAIERDIKILVIDNLTYLCNACEAGDAAGRLMLKLMQLKKKHGWSILVIAHTPKRDLSMPITQNDLAGSKRLFNFFDTVFAMGKSRMGEQFRYIKQLKVRSGAIDYTDENVLVLRLVRRGPALLFTEEGNTYESAHLIARGTRTAEARKQADEKAARREEMRQKAGDLSRQGLSQRTIADRLGVSLGTVNSWLQNGG